MFYFVEISVFSQHANLETGAPAIRNYSPKEYNADPQNWTISQDPRGILYFGNTDGILEFDGKKWNMIPTKNHTLVRSLSVDNQGVIYVAAQNEFGYLASNTQGKVKYISLLSHFSEQEKTFKDVWKCFATKNGVYFFTQKKIFLYQNDTVKTIENYNFLNSFLVHNEFLIFHDSQKGLFLIDNQQLHSLPYTEFFTAEFGNLVILPFEESKILIVTEKKGLFIYDLKKLFLKGKWNFSKKHSFSDLIRELPTSVDNYLAHNGVQCGKKINENLFALATVSGGIVLLNKNGELMQIINKNRGLRNNNVHQLLVDNNQNLWAACDDGISKISLISPITQFSQINGLQGVALITAKVGQTRFCGSADGIFYLPDYQTNIENDQHSFIWANNIKTSFWELLPLGNKVLAGSTKGIFLIDTKNYSQIFPSLGKTYRLIENPKFPNYIFAGVYDGLVALQVQRNQGDIQFLSYKRFNEISDPIRDIAVDSAGNLWLSTLFNGLIYLKFNKNINDYELKSYNTKDGLAQIDHIFLHFSKNELFLATPKGIYKTIIFDNQRVRFVPEINFAEKFAKDSIKTTQIYIDKKQRIWINSGVGVGFLAKNQLGVYDWKPVPFVDKPTYIHQFVVEDSIAWICTNEGLFRYNPNISTNFQTNFNVLIRNVTIRNDSTIFFGTYFKDSLQKEKMFPVFTSQQPEVTFLKLPYKFNSLTFEFAATSFEKESANEYSFQLEGFDKNWSHWDNKTLKEYTNLSAGSYVFRVKAKNIFGIESKEAIYKFKILPPWYRTPWAYAGYVIIGIFLFYAATQYQLRRLKAANLRLEEIVRQRTAEVVQQKEEILAQAELLEQNNKELEKLSLVASETDNAVLIMDEFGRFEWVNEGFRRIFGYSFEQLIKEISENIVGPKTDSYIKEQIEICKTKKISVTYEFETKNFEGKNIWIQTTLTPILDVDGNIRKLVAIDTDISSLKEAQNEISMQKEKLEFQNLQIRKSILYAQTIQNAILPQTDILKQFFDFFIIYKPKDIVSGDFYWFSMVDKMIFLAVVDCTGHGVPGAFMSMIGSRLLNEIVNEKQIFHPSEILKTLNQSIQVALNQSKNDNNDGMDICLCRIEYLDNQDVKIIFGGAKLSLFYYRNTGKEISILKGDRKSIGGARVGKDNFDFSQQELTLQKNDFIYLTTDGIIDQSNISHSRFGTQKFISMLLQNISLSLEEQKNNIIESLALHQGSEEQRDDISILGIKL